tara:strand:+ start:1813 stop:2583 length:771 start_codon:yes stop_codon:yes gene_type:complete
MIKYDVCKFNQVIVDKNEISIEKSYIQELAKKLNNITSQRINRYNKTVVTKTNLREIKLILNKITNENYNDLIKSLTALTKDIRCIKDINEILTSINTRTMFIDLSTKIYIELNNTNKLFLDEAQKDFANLYEDINNVVSIVSEESDYDKLCKNNKKLDVIKNKVIFYTTLSSYKLENITYDELNILIENLLEDMNHFVKIEVIYNIISLNKKVLEENAKWGGIINKLENIKDKTGSFKKISNKILFKTMDILDLM